MNATHTQTQAAKTPAEYNRSRKRPPFHQGITRRGIPDLHKLGGRIIAVDGGAPERVKRDHIFAVDWDETAGEWAIFDYWNPENTTPEQGGASTWAIRQWAARGKLKRGRAYTWPEFVAELRRVYPTIWIPTERAFYAEFGLEYGADGTISNPRNLRPEW